jgi:hypothetical protein
MLYLSLYKKKQENGFDILFDKPIKLHEKIKELVGIKYLNKIRLLKPNQISSINQE